MIALILTVLLLPPVQDELRHLGAMDLINIQRKLEYLKFKLERIEDGYVPSSSPEFDDLDMLLDRADRPENKGKVIP